MHYVVAGFGVAGFWAVKTLLNDYCRSEKMSVTVITAEPSQTYYKCFLAEYIARKNPVHDLSAAAQLRDDPRLTIIREDKLASIDHQNKLVRLESGNLLRYDKLLLATGMLCAGSSAAGKDVEGVFRFNNLQDAQGIQSFLTADKKNAVIVGENIFGIEMARALYMADKKVTVLCEGNHFAQHLFDVPTSELILKQFPQDITVLKNARVKQYLDTDGIVSGILLEDSRIVPADIVGVCEPFIACTGYLQSQYLRPDTKILVNEQMMTELPDIYAAGDLACLFDEPLELSYGWRRALFQGQIAARTMLEIPAWYTLPPSMRIQVFGYPLILLGKSVQSFDKSELYPLEYSDAGRDVKKRIYLQDGVIVSAVLCGNMDKFTVIEELIKDQLPCSPGEMTTLLEYLQPYSEYVDKMFERYCPICKTIIDFSLSADHGSVFSCPICGEVLRIGATSRYERDLLVHHVSPYLNKI